MRYTHRASSKARQKQADICIHELLEVREEIAEQEKPIPVERLLFLLHEAADLLRISQV